MPRRSQSPEILFEVVPLPIGNTVILDTLENSEQYLSLHPGFASAFAFLRDLRSHEISRHDVDGEGIYAITTKQDGKSESDAALEAHRRYIDIHYCIVGVEKIGWKSLDACHEVGMVYDAEKDFMTFGDPPESWVVLRPGSFAVFFPGDAHAPMVSSGIVHKIVVKVAVGA